MRSLRSLVFGGLLLIGGAFVFQACGTQSEGMRCELLNGNEDCESSLTCQERCGFSLCCPASGGSVAECRQECATTGTDTGVTTDTGTVVDTGTTTDTGAADTGAPDTGSDTGTAADTAEAG